MRKKFTCILLSIIISVTAFGCTRKSDASKQSENTPVAEKSDSKETAAANTSAQAPPADTAAASNPTGSTPTDTKPQTPAESTTAPAQTGPETANSKSQTAESKPETPTTGPSTTDAKPQTKATAPAPSKQASDDPIMALGKLEFSLEDIEGDKYNSSDIFKENKLTMINIWGTLCTPCIKELPELQELSGELGSKDIGIIGLVGDVNGDDGLEDALAIVKKQKVTFVNLVPDDSIRENLLSNIKGYPVTIFVDSNGNLVGEVVIGAKSKEEYKKVAEKTLSTLK